MGIFCVTTPCYLLLVPLQIINQYIYLDWEKIWEGKYKRDKFMVIVIID